MQHCGPDHDARMSGNRRLGVPRLVGGVFPRLVVRNRVCCGTDQGIGIGPFRSDFSRALIAFSSVT